MSGLIDTHCHLDLVEVPVGRAGRRQEAGVDEVITIGISVPSSVQAVVFAHAHPEVYATVGLHPHDARTWNDKTAEELERLARDERVVAIGECGLDYYRDLSPRDDQRRAFIGQIELARRVGKALVVHVREAADEALALLDEHAGGLTVVLHCFCAAADSGRVPAPRLLPLVRRQCDLQERRRPARGGAPRAGRQAAVRDRRALPHARSPSAARTTCRSAWCTRRR